MTYTPETEAFYALPAEIRERAEELAGPIREMTRMEVLLVIGKAIEQSAGLAEEMMQQHPCAKKPWARMALAIAAKTIRRGRHLTDEERHGNLLNAIEKEDR